MKKYIGFVLTLLLTGLHAHAQASHPPRVLIVVAHPDDEYFFAGTTYRITHDLKGTVDQVVITDGRGGFRYSLLSQPLYRETLTDSSVAAEKLPEIRRNELAESGKILGIGHHYFLNHLDQKTLDLNETYQLWGGKDQVKSEIRNIIVNGNYDFIFTLLPTESNHGHHKAAGILSLEIVNELPVDQRPVILASVAKTDGDSPEAIHQDDPEDARDYRVYRDLTLTAIRSDLSLSFDRAASFGFNHALSYQIVVDWMIAAHKSQGAFQGYYNKHRFEDFKVFTLNSPAATEKARLLFLRLAEPTADTTFKP